MSKLDVYNATKKFANEMEGAFANHIDSDYFQRSGMGISTYRASLDLRIWNLLAKAMNENVNLLFDHARGLIKDELERALKEAQDEAIETIRNLGRGE